MKTKLTHNFKVGDTVKFTGAEHLLLYDEQTNNLLDVWFGADSACGIILEVKEDPKYGGEAEIFCDGEIMIMPWRLGLKPKMWVICEGKC